MSSMPRATSESLRNQKKRKRKRRKRMMRRILTCLMLVVAVVSGAFAAKVNYEVTDAFSALDRDTSSDLSNVLDDSDLLSDSDVINILLIGSDKRGNWKQTGRSDSVMIATIDNKNKELKLTSLMRDMYVEIPDNGYNRFNAAYSFGGVSLLYETIANNFNIRLDGYVLVDFEAFKSVIDELGGVDIELTEKEYKYLTTAYKRGSVLDVVSGMNTMNGEQALAYTRIRQDANGDFGRTQRQRNVISALFTKAKSMPLNDLVSLAKTVLPYVTTDLTDSEILSYMKTVLFMGTTDIHQMRIPVDNSFENTKVNKMAVLSIDLEQNQEALRQFIFQSVEE